MASRKQVRNEARRRLGPGSEDGYKVRARSVRGLCTVSVTRRSRSPLGRGQTVILGRARTWERALRQMRGGFVLEA